MRCWLGSTVILWAIVGGTSFLLTFLGEGCFHWCAKMTSYVGRGRRCQWRTFRTANTHLDTTRTQQATRTLRLRAILDNALAQRTDCLPYVYLGSVLPSSRSVIQGTTRTQPTSHTSNRVAYSRSDASSAEEQGWLEGIVDRYTRLVLLYKMEPLTTGIQWGCHTYSAGARKRNGVWHP